MWLAPPLKIREGEVYTAKEPYVVQAQNRSYQNASVAVENI